MAACVVCQCPAAVFCRNDAAFLCNDCDHKIHSSNSVASRHSRVKCCELCKKKPSTCYCKQDQAFLCQTCDLQIHQDNPLASRHEIVPVHEAEQELAAQKNDAVLVPCESAAHSQCAPCNPSGVERDENSLGSAEIAVVPTVSSALDVPTKEASVKVAWSKDFDALEFDNSWLDRLEVGFDFADLLAQENDDALVPVIQGFDDQPQQSKQQSQQDDFLAVPNMPEDSGFNRTNSISSNSLDNFLNLPQIPFTAPPPFSGPFVPPPPGALPPLFPTHLQSFPLPTSLPPMPTSASGNWQLPGSTLHVGSQATLNREQRVARYREKRKNRKFEKTIRYASRKAYAEIRPRIKGRFAKKEEVEAWMAAHQGMPLPENLD